MCFCDAISLHPTRLQFLLFYEELDQEIHISERGNEEAAPFGSMNFSFKSQSVAYARARVCICVSMKARKVRYA